MIKAKPQVSTLVTLLLFLVISLTLLCIHVIVVTTDPAPQWFNYLIITVLSPVVVFVAHRVVFRYKKIKMGDHMITVQFPLLRITRAYSLDEVSHWNESIVKTGKTATYKELEIKFKDGRIIRMGYQEYTEYDKMIRYLTQKIPKVKGLSKTQP